MKSNTAKFSWSDLDILWVLLFMYFGGPFLLMLFGWAMHWLTTLGM